ncbi:polycystic kidney disease protein 1-like 3 [Prionailurus iriomotensis]
MVNIEDTIKLLLRVTSNPAGVSLLASLLGFYMLTFVQAWRKDQTYMQKVTVMTLIPKALHSVLSRWNKMEKQQQQQQQQQQTFTRRGSPLEGNCTACGSGMTIRGPALFEESSPRIICGSENQFTRLQRLSCCMTLLLCDMVVNVMFWRKTGTTAQRDEQGIKGDCGIPTLEKYVPTLKSCNNLYGVLPTLTSRVLQRLQSHLSALGPTQADRPCDILDATSQLQELQELLEIHILPTEQGPFSLELNKDQATNWVISVILSVLQNIFISQLVKAIVLTLSISLMRNRMPCLTKEKEQQTRRILALLAKCSPLPGSRDKNNPVYTAPAFHSPVQILFLFLLMTAVYSAQNSSRFYLHQAIWKRFSHHFSEIRLLKHFYPQANLTFLTFMGITECSASSHSHSWCHTSPNWSISPRTSEAISQDQEDTENCGVNGGSPDTNITKSDSIWRYQDQEILGGYPIQGEFAIYSGGGYVVRLGRSSSTAAR